MNKYGYDGELERSLESWGLLGDFALSATTVYLQTPSALGLDCVK